MTYVDCIMVSLVGSGMFAVLHWFYNPRIRTMFLRSDHHMVSWCNASQQALAQVRLKLPYDTIKKWSLRCWVIYNASLTKTHWKTGDVNLNSTTTSLGDQCMGKCVIYVYINCFIQVRVIMHITPDICQLIVVLNRTIFTFLKSINGRNVFWRVNCQMHIWLIFPHYKSLLDISV